MDDRTASWEGLQLIRNGVKRAIWLKVKSRLSLDTERSCEDRQAFSRLQLNTFSLESVGCLRGWVRGWGSVETIHEGEPTLMANSVCNSLLVGGQLLCCGREVYRKLWQARARRHICSDVVL